MKKFLRALLPAIVLFAALTATPAHAGVLWIDDGPGIATVNSGEQGSATGEQGLIWVQFLAWLIGQGPMGNT